MFLTIRSAHMLPAEHIPNPSHSLNQPGIGGILLQFFTQPAYMNIDGACIPRIVIAPDVMEQLVACEHGAAVAHEIGEQFKLFWLQLQVLPAANDPSASKIDTQRSSHELTFGWSRRLTILLFKLLASRSGKVRAT